MQIRELSTASGVPAKTIRYYESIGLLPLPTRAGNGYRQYAPDAREHLSLIVSLRDLGLSLADIALMLKARDKGTLPCSQVIATLDRRLDDIDRGIAELQALKGTLQRIVAEGKDLPPGKTCDEHCLCHRLPVTIACS